MNFLFFRSVLLVFITISSSTYAIDSILLTGFDPFGKIALGNNSTKTARSIVYELQKEFPNKEIKFCQLRTVYHKATEILLDCIHSMQKRPELILSFGETGCGRAKLETRAYNWLSGTADNAGVVYRGQVIDSNFPKHYTSTIDWRDAYCNLADSDKNKVEISNNAGSFVCNETLFNMSTKYPEFNFGFIHVPKASCLWGGRAKRNIAKAVVKKLVRNLILQSKVKKYTYPVNQTEAELQAKEAPTSCDRDFFTRLSNYL